MHRPGSPYSPSQPIGVGGMDYLDQNAKRYVVETVQPVDADSETGARRLEDPKWQPGFFNQFPILGFSSLVVALMCAAGSIVTLLVSNGKSQTHWPERFAPNVILSGLNSVANICYGIAIGNGIAIAWWRQALKGATIEQLHKSWSFSSSMKEIAMAGKYFNVIALAALTTKLTIVDNMLMQRATTTNSYQDNGIDLHNITMYANDSIPATATVSAYTGEAGVLNTNLNRDLITWLHNGGQMPAYGNGTAGTYFVNVPAAGFEFDCSKPVATPINYGILTRTNQTLSPTLFSLTFNSDVVGNETSPLLADDTHYSYLTMDASWTTADDQDGNMCPGTMTTQSCKLRPAVVQYPLMVQNLSTTGNGEDYNSATALYTQGTATFDTEDDYELGGDGPSFGLFNQSIKQTNGFEVLHYKNILDVGLFADVPTYLLGLQKAFNQHLGGEATITFQGAQGWTIDETNNAYQYLTFSPENVASSCGYKYLDPINVDPFNTTWVLNSVVTSINQIMFTLATDIYYNQASYPDGDAYSAPQTTYNATLYRDVVHYETHTAYMWGAFASMLVCIILILPTYWGYWQLGRKVSLGPFEIAHAFRSPMTAEASNGNVDELLKEVGHREVKYGQIVAGDAKGVLGIAEPEYVARVHPKVGSARTEINEKMQQTFGR